MSSSPVVCLFRTSMRSKFVKSLYHLVEIKCTVKVCRTIKLNKCQVSQRIRTTAIGSTMRQLSFASQRVIKKRHKSTHSTYNDLTKFENYSHVKRPLNLLNTFGIHSYTVLWLPSCQLHSLCLRACTFNIHT